MLPDEPHYQVPVTTIARKYNMPNVFYLDLWPVACGQVVVTDPDVALHMTTIRNHPKHEAEKWFIDPLIGEGNIVTTEGPRWKYLHKMRMKLPHIKFNRTCADFMPPPLVSPAFSITHISNLRPMVAAVSRP